MKKITFLCALFMLSFYIHAQLVATIEITEDIPGICSKEHVYALIPSLKGQVEATNITNDEIILKRLNSEVKFLKNNLKYKEKGSIQLIINCKGALVRFEMHTKNKKQSIELVKEMEVVFKSLGVWKAGKLDKEDVDSVLNHNYTIVNGVIIFN